MYVSSNISKNFMQKCSIAECNLYIYPRFFDFRLRFNDSLIHFFREYPFNALFIQPLKIEKRDRFNSVSFIMRTCNYSMISVTTPEPTVLPPSLIANLSPSSIAIGVINAIVIVTLSPGIHISVPSGNCRSPVTSVVLK